MVEWCDDGVLVDKEEWKNLAITLSNILFRLRPGWTQAMSDPILLASQIERAIREE